MQTIETITLLVQLKLFVKSNAKIHLILYVKPYCVKHNNFNTRVKMWMNNIY